MTKRDPREEAAAARRTAASRERIERSRAIREFNAKVPPRHPEMAVDPSSSLARLLARLKRPERRLMLAFLQMARTPRRFRTEKELHRRFRAQGIEG